MGLPSCPVILNMLLFICAQLYTKLWISLRNTTYRLTHLSMKLLSSKRFVCERREPVGGHGDVDLSCCDDAAMVDFGAAFSYSDSLCSKKEQALMLDWPFECWFFFEVIHPHYRVFLDITKRTQ